MQDDRDYSVYPSDLDVLGAFTKFYQYLKGQGYTPMKRVTEGFYFEITVSPHRTLHAENYDEFLSLLAEHPKALPISIHTRFEKDKVMGFAFIIRVRSSGLETSVRCDHLEVLSSIHDRIRENFKAYNPNEDRKTEFFRRGLKKSVFLAHRFDENGTETAASLSEFLRRLGFDVKEGSGYEGRDIPDKVSERIRSQDILVALVTKGDPSWILSEVAYAKALGRQIIVIIEKGCEFKKGILGSDFEHMEFPVDQLEKCYSSLVYALPV